MNKSELVAAVVEKAGLKKADAEKERRNRNEQKIQKNYMLAYTKYLHVRQLS